LEVFVSFRKVLLIAAFAPLSVLGAQQRVMSSVDALSLPSDPARTIAPGETKRAALAATDHMLSDSSHFGRWQFQGSRGQRVTVNHRSSAFDTYLFVGKQGAAEIAGENDDTEGTDSEVSLTLPDDGVYVILAGSFAPKETGEYAVTLTVRDPLPGMTGPQTPQTLLLRETEPMQRVGLDQRFGSQLDAKDGKMDDATHYELWYFNANAGDEISVALESREFSGAVFVGPQGGREVSQGAVGARPQVNFTAQATGTYVVVVKGNSATDLGSYMLELQRKPRTP